ncbi:MAG: hypothetical protein EAZ92_10005 [Candidatus Kapaibacterium sp.]|nr:MAG: hypothetical protein EAZ92_10005 [Candidatus Kapabacteria bacterium]
MAQTRTHEDFRTGGVVSVWLGSIGIEDDLDDYLADDFADDFGFEIIPEDGPEFDVANPARPVAALLDGFSCYEDFIEEAVAAAKEQGWEKANCALVFYNFAYEEVATNDDAPLVFIGTFAFAFDEEEEE